MKKNGKQKYKTGRVSNWSSTVSGNSAGLTYNRLVGTRLSLFIFIWKRKDARCQDHQRMLFFIKSMRPWKTLPSSFFKNKNK